MDIARDSREDSNRCLFVYLVFSTGIYHHFLQRRGTQFGINPAGLDHLFGVYIPEDVDMPRSTPYTLSSYRSKKKPSVRLASIR